MAQRPTVRDVAMDAGVSLATVSMVLNGKVGISAETRQRVLMAIERLGYQRRGQRTVIGLLIERLSVPAYSDPLVGQMLSSIEIEAGRRGYHVLLASVERGSTDLPAMVLEQQVGGLIVVGGGDLSDLYIRALAETGLPLVLVDNYVNGLAVPCVLGDNVTGAYLATRHLIERGHRRIALLEGPRKYKTLTERREGYLRAMDEAGLPVDLALLVQPMHVDSRKGYHETKYLFERAVEQQPSAIVAISDKTALGAMDALKDVGRRVPDDVALVGFDDVAESALATPALTTVRLPARSMGETAAQRLIELLEGAEPVPAKVVLYTELIIRQSSGHVGPALDGSAEQKGVSQATDL